MKLFFGLSVVFFLTTTMLAQQAQAPAQKQTTGAGATINFTAKSANVSESGTAIRINILRWSTDEERNPLLTALNPPPPAPPAPAVAAGLAAAEGVEVAALRQLPRIPLVH